MRIVTLEEHFSLLNVNIGGGTAAPPRPAIADAENMPLVVRNVGDKITDLDGGRIADMDRHGISVQVLSKAGIHMGPSADMFEDAEAVVFARNFNDECAPKNRRAARSVCGVRTSCRQHPRSGGGRVGAHRRRIWF